LLRYFGAYTLRVAISNHRLVALAEGNVTFRWRDSRQQETARDLPVEPAAVSTIRMFVEQRRTQW
jgi:Putative transposase